ncbi:MAG: tRNA (5-methylaminomethyl-2-thiouridylate)-methyltransferase [Pseudomonadales bacterium]|nr:tRNA (5-methylaminomethyl-2-thiouridylate)-methyltransferase [Pseudomonadales bacterium]
MAEQKRAVALISGGLDSMLAAKVIMEQGVHVEGVNFFTGFCVEGHTHAIRKKKQKKEQRNNALWVAEQLGIKLHIVDVIDEYKDVLLNPKHGYGANMNPCLDCKIFMVKKAEAWSFMEDNGFDFIITGEVIGQRPKSQRRETMPIIARESGVEDRLLRPLCAKHLPPTLPEREGWVNREDLHDFQGRNRKPQIALAESYGFTDWAQPAGGCCFLTDEVYSNKLVDLWEARGTREYELDGIMLLKVGRHIRPKPNFKVIVGREEGENRYLEGYRQTFLSIRATSHKGPLALIDGQANEADIELAAQIVARYGQGKDAQSVTAEIRFPDGQLKELTVGPLAGHQIDPKWHV